MGGGRWVAKLASGNWVRAHVVVCGPLSAPSAWVERFVATQATGCPWDGLPAIATRHPSGERRKLAELEEGTVLVLGLASAAGHNDVVVACTAASHPVYSAYEHG